MKKLFLLIPVLALSLLANATTTTIGPDDSEVTVNNKLISALGSAEDGDVIILTDGIYNESSTYVVFNKNVEVRAANGASPVVQVDAYIKVEGGKHAIIKGITFDGSAQGSRDQYFRFTDNGNNILELDNCTFNNVKKNIFRCESGKKFSSLDVKNCTFTGSLSNVMKLESNLCGTASFDGCEFSNTAEIVIHGTSASHLDECIVNDCYFHNNAKQSIYFEASGTEGTETCDELTVTNSTFTNTTALTNWISVIDIRPYSTPSEIVSDAIKVRVDHCTFYNNPCVDSGHANIRTHFLSDVSVSNCIFMHPTELAQRATYCDGGGTISNCLAYNFTKDPSNYAHAWGPTVTSCAIGDPLFTDAANGDYSYAGNWVTPSLSPARCAGTDGSDLGDPRWYSDETLPSTSFASPYAFTGAKAVVNGNMELDASNYIHSKTSGGNAIWKVSATRACAVQVTLNMSDATTSGHNYQVEIFDADGNSVGSLSEGNWYNNTDDKTLAGFIYLPAANDYKIVLTNSISGSKATIKGITLSYIGGAVQSMPGTTAIADAWFSSNGTRADGKITFPSGKHDAGWVKWNVAFTSAGNYNVTVNVNNTDGHNFTVALYRSESDESPISVGEGGSQYSSGSPNAIALGAMEVPAGNYIMKVTDAVAWSDAELLSVTFTYAGGGIIEFDKDDAASLLPNADVILSDDWSIEEEMITYAESKATTGWAKWNVSCGYAATYNVTVNISSDNGHLMRVQVFEDEAAAAIYTLDETESTRWSEGTLAINLGNIALSEREYVIKLSNTQSSSHAKISSITITYAGGATVNIPNNAIPLGDAILSANATRNLSSNPKEIHFNGSDQYAKWNIHATTGIYTFTFDVVASESNYGKYKLDINQGNTNVFTYTKGNTGSGQITISDVLITATGDYVLQMADVNSGDGYLTSLAATAAEDIIIIDENETDPSVLVDGTTGKKPQLIRSFKANMFNTICLPFDSYDEELVSIFGSDYVLLEMNSAELSGDVLNLGFTTIAHSGSNYSAGKPYLIKPTKDVVNPKFGLHTIHFYEYNNPKTCTNAYFIGSFTKTTIAASEDNLFLGANDTLYFSNHDVTLKGTRAYFQLRDVPAGAPVRKARIVEQGNVVTELELIDGEWQDIKSANGLIKTIENGQLILIRDGKRYNAMGIRF